MNLLSWLDALSRPSTETPATRRAALTQLGRAVAAAVPLSGLATTALARPASVTTDALNVLLRVAYAQQALFDRALTTPALFPAGAEATAQKLGVQYREIAALMRTSIERSGEVAESPRNYDFTGSRSSAQNGPLAPFTNYDDFLQVAQALGDLLSRAFIGQLSVFLSSSTFADLGAQLLATASRAAALLRRRRQERGAALAPWITRNDLGGLNALLAPIYAGEDNVRHFAGASPTGLDLTAASTGLTTYSVAVVTEAFDEPLKASDVLAAVDLFLIP